MKPNLATRKPVVKLTATDLKTFPVWEFAIDEEGTPGMDETWVRPLADSSVRKNAYSQIVATDFRTRIDRKLQGFMVVSTVDKRVDITAGAIVGKFGYQTLPSMSRALAAHRKATWSIAERDRLLKALKERDADVFPLRYALRVLIRGERDFRAGTVK